MNDYALRKDLLELLEKHGLVAEEQDIVPCRRGFSTSKDRLLISIVCREVRA